MVLAELRPVFVGRMTVDDVKTAVTAVIVWQIAFPDQPSACSCAIRAFKASMSARRPPGARAGSGLYWISGRSTVRRTFPSSARLITFGHVGHELDNSETGVAA